MLAYLPPLHIHIEAQPHDDILGAVLPASTTELIGLMLWDVHGIATPQPQVQSKNSAFQVASLVNILCINHENLLHVFLLSLCLRSWG